VRPLRAEGVILDGGRRARRQTNINLDVPANGPAHIVQRFVVVPCSSSSCNNAAIRGIVLSVRHKHASPCCAPAASGRRDPTNSAEIAGSSHQISMVAAAITSPVTNAAKPENSRRSFSTPVMAASPMRASDVGVSSPEGSSALLYRGGNSTKPVRPSLKRERTLSSHRQRVWNFHLLKPIGFSLTEVIDFLALRATASYSAANPAYMSEG
jgi:hypothetical protein